jgi:surfactin synthase thioesterase subunit
MFLDKGKSKYIGDVVSMFDERLYKRWDKLSQALKTNKPIEEKQVADIESLFDKAKSSQEVEQVQKFTHAMYGISIGPAMALELINCRETVAYPNVRDLSSLNDGISLG